MGFLPGLMHIQKGKRSTLEERNNKTTCRKENEAITLKIQPVSPERRDGRQEKAGRLEEKCLKWNNNRDAYRRDRHYKRN
jgi:hypothetical protein